MTDDATTIANAVGQLNSGDVDGYTAALYHPHCQFHGSPEPFGTDLDGITQFFRVLVDAVPQTATTTAKTSSPTAIVSRCASR